MVLKRRRLKNVIVENYLDWTGLQESKLKKVNGHIVNQLMVLVIWSLCVLLQQR